MKIPDRCHFALPAVVNNLLLHFNSVDAGSLSPKIVRFSSVNSDWAYSCRRDFSARSKAFLDRARGFLVDFGFGFGFVREGVEGPGVFGVSELRDISS